MSAPAMHGMVLTAQDVDYTDLTKYGTVTIKRDKDGNVLVLVRGFDFANYGSCRQLDAKACAWARDVLTTALAADKLVPGGRITTVSE